MQYVLFHKDDYVANIEFSDTGIYKNVNGYYNKELLPVGLRNCDDNMIHTKFDNWLESRFFTTNRTNRTRVLNLADCVKAEQLIRKSYGLSINDCYWFKPLEEADKPPFWDDINLFDHPGNNFVANILLFNQIDLENVNFFSPDLTTSGIAEKAWILENGKYTFFKCGLKKYNYIDCANEVISSILCDILHAKTANYSCGIFEDGRVFVYTKCFTNKNIEFFPFSQLAVEKGYIGKQGVLKFIKENNLTDELNKLLVHDFILSVPDRDFTNIGFLRDSNTLKVLSLAPIFSSGHGLWLDHEKHGINVLDEAKTFDSSHSHQINLVTDFSFIDYEKLSLFTSDIIGVYKQFNIPQEVIDEIVSAVKIKINELSKIINAKASTESFKQDINKNNIAQNSGFSLANGTQGGFGF